MESVAFRLHGWAAWHEAWNLVTSEPTLALLPKIKDIVGRLKFFGNNGFGDSFGKKQAHTVLAALLGSGSLDHDLILGAVLAAGVPPRGINNLSRLSNEAAER